MGTRITLSKVLTVGLALAMLISLASLAQATAINLAPSGFNADEVFGTSGGGITAAVDNGTDAWAETGYLGVVTSGLPTSGSFVSGTGSGVTYDFQSYAQNNALRMGNGNPSSGILGVTPGRYSTLYILATSGNGGGSSNITLTFSDLSTSTYTNALYAPDWYDATPGVSNVALALRQRVDTGGTIDTAHDAHFQLYESVLNLLSADQAKILTSITFNEATGGSGVTNVYAVDGSPVPVPATVWLLGTGLVGLAGLRRRFGR